MSNPTLIDYALAFDETPEGLQAIALIEHDQARYPITGARASKKADAAVIQWTRADARQEGIQLDLRGDASAPSAARRLFDAFVQGEGFWIITELDPAIYTESEATTYAANVKPGVEVVALDIRELAAPASEAPTQAHRS